VLSVLQPASAIAAAIAADAKSARTKWRRFNRRSPQPLGFPKPSLFNRYPEPKPAARQAGSPTERPDVDLGVIR
jgi:hypothetical protein